MGDHEKYCLIQCTRIIETWKWYLECCEDFYASKYFWDLNITKKKNMAQEFFFIIIACICFYYSNEKTVKLKKINEFRIMNNPIKITCQHMTQEN